MDQLWHNKPTAMLKGAHRQSYTMSCVSREYNKPHGNSKIVILMNFRIFTSAHPPLSCIPSPAVLEGMVDTVLVRHVAQHTEIILQTTHTLP